MYYLIGVDLGTQGTKTSLLNENCEVIQEAFEESRLIYPSAGAAEQDPEEMLGSVLRTVKQVVESSGINPKRVAGIGLSGQMAGIMGVDREGMASTPYDSWLDTRCGAYRQPFLDVGEEKVISITGTPVTYAHGPKILWWKHEHPDAYKNTHSFVLPGVYCVMRMCGLSGGEAYTDYTYIHFSGFADTANKRWSQELLHALGVDAAKMPRIIKPYDKVGGLTNEMAAQCGLPEGTPMVAGCGDTAASSFGAGIVKSGLMFDIAGTASVLAFAANSFTPDTKHKTMLFASSIVDGLYTPMAYINGGGMCLKWLRDNVLNKTHSYAELDGMAAQAPAGSEDLLFLPHFSGRVCPNDTLARGSYINLSWKHQTAHMYRAIMEGIAYEYGIYTDIMRELSPNLGLERIISVGGGSASRIFKKIKADALGVPVSTINLTNAAALACCVIAGYGVGLYNDLTERIEKSVSVCDTVAPDPALYDFYQKRKDIYAEVFSSLHSIYGKLGGL
ncbi:MAG: FGGY family carbohydrate kinase [Defluviitaleaceae bacterium]|nr:FGGY family carbohydrate kinase [Defluviitaleaceae bacterium]MCL2837097.1 FGGY family carbohydrate kinase [Defluviitaleaceae bacterium]